ncbi:MAG: glycine zipper 2TM domain-containing protein [Pseudomonadota bacterium]
MACYSKSLSVIVLLLCSTSLVLADNEQQSTTLGTVLGSVVGGVIGYQFGGGSGKYISTAAGAVIGSAIGRNIHHNQNQKNNYQPEYAYQSKYAYPEKYDTYQNTYRSEVVHVYRDDYLIKQQLSDARKRRNMIRNGEIEETSYDVSDVQTSWDDPDN